MLNKVKLLKHDSCYTYALKRVGLFNMTNVCKSAEEFLKDFDRDKPHLSELKKGDLLVYESEISDKNTLELARVIDREGKILWEEVHTNLHFMVYEGNGICSDACVESDIYLGIRCTDIRNVSSKWERLIPKQK